MSQAEALLQSMTDDVHTHEHVVTDHDSYFVIDPDSRVIENASQTENTVMQYDHNSEKFTFELPRHVEGHDMTLCNRVRVHFNNVDGETNEENADVAELYDLTVCPDDSDKVRCSWSITRQATQLAGTLNFLVQFECIDDAGASVYEWHTDIYTDVVVKKGRNNAEQAVIEYSNVLEQWYQRIFGAGDSVIAAVAAEGDRQKEAIARKAEETLATIPEDYTTTYNMAKEALRRKANAIELDAEGENIFVNDSSDAYLLGLNVYGKTTQKTTTGRQLFDAYAERNESFANAVIENDGAKITVTGNYYVSWPIVLKAGVEYYVDFKVSGDTTYRAVRFEYPDKEITNTITNPATFTPTQDTVSVYLYAGLGTEDTVVYNNVQISEGSNALPWEPYTGGIPAPNPEYSQELESVENPAISIYSGDYEPSKPIQSLTVNRTLRGIPVTSGGNYTDVNGQQWICDEVDFERGVYVQRVFRETVTFHEEQDVNGVRYRAFLSHNSDPTFNGLVLCDKLVFNPHVNPGSNGIRISTFSTNLAIACYEDDVVDSACVLYPLATPIETPLTEEEIAYYKKLKTYYHNTTVINDHNAHMAIKYAADTEIFLRDNQPKPTDEQIQAAVSEYASQNGVQVPSDDHIREIAKQVVPDSSQNPTGTKVYVTLADDGTIVIAPDVGDGLTNGVTITASLSDDGTIVIGGE